MRILLVPLILALGVSACNKRPKRLGWKTGEGQSIGTEGPSNPAPTETGDMASPTPGLDLVWKRYRAFEHGLTQGLGLNKADFCLELGSKACIDQVHLTVLGGNEPYKAGQFDRAQAPTVLTAIAVDRVVLSACSQRLELDRKAGSSALVFKHFPLSGSAPGNAALEAQTKELYQKILARDPEAAEIKAVTALGTQGLANDKLALMLCYAIASSSENLLL